MTREEYLSRWFALLQRHPWLFAGRNIGHHIESGWLLLFEELCDKLEALVPVEQRNNVYFSQVKEKFGGLRAYLSIVPTRFDIIDRGVSLEIGSRVELHQVLGPVVHAAEAASQHTCQYCGAEGTIVDQGGLYSTLCGIHAAYDHDARAANFELFTTQGVVPVPPSNAQARERLLAARDELEGHDIKNVAVVGPGDGRDKPMAVIYQVRTADGDPDSRWQPWRELPKILGWPALAIIDTQLPHFTKSWNRAGGGKKIPWLFPGQNRDAQREAEVLPALDRGEGVEVETVMDEVDDIIANAEAWHVTD